MSMVTRCPGCATTFRVTPAQLQAQNGMVRCGRCATVFDGFKSLATLTEAGLRTESSAPRASSGGSSLPPPEPAPAAGNLDAQAPVARPLIEQSPAQAQIAVEQSYEFAASEPQPSPATELPAAAPVVQAAPSAAEEDSSAVRAQPPLVQGTLPEEARPRRRGAVWGGGAFLLLLALAAQAAYLYRSEIAANVPEARPYLNRLCASLRCTVALPQRPRSINIEASDMQAIDPANPGLIALTATLRNHATIALGYPALDVVLTNTREHTVARRIFMPPEYLDAGTDARAGIPPNAEVTLKLNIDSGDLGAAGFRLDLLPAPAR